MTASEGRSRMRVLGAGALVVAALAVGHAVTTTGNTDSAVTAPFLRSGSVGTPVQLRYATVTVTSVGGAPSVDAAGTILKTPGVFVIAYVKIVAVGKERNLLYAAVRGSDGHTYVAAPGERSTFDFGDAQPGVPEYGSVCVELPRAAAVGARLRIALDPGDQGRDDMADVDLKISPLDLHGYLARTAPVELPLSGLHPGQAS